MKNAINKTVEAGVKLDKVTRGKKTYALSTAMVLFQGFVGFFPNALNAKTENIIEWSIATGLLPTLGHKLWRNRHKAVEYTRDAYKWLKNALKRK
jgi:hypothetical protein